MVITCLLHKILFLIIFLPTNGGTVGSHGPLLGVSINVLLQTKRFPLAPSFGGNFTTPFLFEPND